MNTTQKKIKRSPIFALLFLSMLLCQFAAFAFANDDIKKVYDEAVGYYSNQDYNRSLSVIQNAMRYFPNNYNLLYLSGLNYFKLKNYRQAADFLKRAKEANENPLSNDKSSIDYVLLLSLALDKNPREADNMIVRAILEPEQEAQVRLIIANSFFTQKDYRNAEKYYTMLVEKFAGDLPSETLAKAYRNLGYSHLLQNNKDKAAQAFDEAINSGLEVDANFATTYGMLLQANGSNRDAGSYFALALEKGASSDVPYTQLGIIHYNEKDYSSALQVASMGLEKDKNSKALKAIKGLANANLSNYQDAIEFLKDVTSQRGFSDGLIYEVNKWLGISYLKIAEPDYRKAEKPLKECSQKDRNFDDKQVLWNLISVYYNTKNYRDGQSLVDKALRTKDDAELYRFKAHFISMQPNPSSNQIIEAMENFLKKGAANGWDYYILGMAYNNDGKRDKAIQYLQQSVTKNPSNFAGLFNLAAIYLNNPNITPSELNSAEGLLTQAVAIDPKNSSFPYYWLAQVQARLNKAQECLNSLTLAKNNGFTNKSKVSTDGAFSTLLLNEDFKRRVDQIFD